VRHVGVPDRALGVDADPVRGGVAEVGPDPPAGQATVGADVERGQPVPVRLRYEQGRVVGGDRHAVGEREPVGYRPCRTARRHQGDRARLVGRPAHEVEARGVQVGVAPPVHHDVVPARGPEIGVGDEGAVGLPAQQPPVRGRHDDQPPVRQPRGTQWQGRHPGHHLGVAFEVDRDDLTGRPVGEVQPVAVPAWRLDQPPPVEQHPHVICLHHASSSLSTLIRSSRSGIDTLRRSSSPCRTPPIATSDLAS
jgi:hypothetical protein